MTDRDDDSLGPVLEALYRVASDPTRWEELVEALPFDGAAPPADRIASDLRRSVEIAERVAATVGPAAARLTGEARLNRRLEVTSLDASFRHLTGLTAKTSVTVLDFTDDSVEALERAARRVDGSGQAAFVVLRLGGSPDRLVGRLSAEDSGYLLRLSAPLPPALSIGPALGLSRAESRLVDQLRGTGSLREAAEALDISVNTARNQLASVFDKLGIGRQSDLVAVLTEAAAQMEREAPESQDGPPREALRLADGRRLTFRRYGQTGGRPVLAFHEGMGCSLLPSTTTGLANAAGLQVIAADRPGYGGSDPLKAYSFVAVARDMEALCDHLGVRDVILMGLLSGVSPMLETAARFGTRARRAVLLSGRAPGDAGGASNLLWQFRARLVRNTWATQTVLRLLRSRNSPEAAARMLQRAAEHSAGDAEFLAGHQDVPAFISRCVAEALSQDAAGPAAEAAAALSADHTLLSRVSAPLTLFHGAEDGLAPLGALQRYLGEHPYELREIAGIGQFMALKHWDEIVGSL